MPKTKKVDYYPRIVIATLIFSAISGSLLASSEFFGWPFEGLYKDRQERTARIEAERRFGRVPVKVFLEGWIHKSHLPSGKNNFIPAFPAKAKLSIDKWGRPAIHITLDEAIQLEGSVEILKLE